MAQLGRSRAPPRRRLASEAKAQGPAGAGGGEAEATEKLEEEAKGWFKARVLSSYTLLAELGGPGASCRLGGALAAFRAR